MRTVLNVGRYTNDTPTPSLYNRKIDSVVPAKPSASISSPESDAEWQRGDGRLQHVKTSCWRELMRETVGTEILQQPQNEQ